MTCRRSILASAQTLTLAAALAGIGGCRAVQQTDLKADEDLPAGSSLGFCAAIRGNGTYIFSHFGAMSRAIEEYGEIDAVAGGSSASITAFLYESMVQNPALNQTRGPERQAQLALLMKSIMGYTDAVRGTDVAQAVTELYQVAAAVASRDLERLSRTDPERARTQLRLLLDTPSVRGLINPVLLASLSDEGSRSPREVQEATRAVQSITNFDATDRGVFFREGAINFAGLANLLGQVGNFYAGADPVVNASLSEFIQACTADSRGRTWDELKAVNGRCDPLLRQAADMYFDRANRSALQINLEDDRLGQTVGHTIPTFLVSGILQGPAAVEAYRRGLAAYEASPENPRLDVDFNDVRFGFFMPSAYTPRFSPDALAAAFPGDERARKMMVLNGESSPTWATVMLYSPLEPGLSRIQIDPARPNERAYIGGWADLAPTMPLRLAGCERIIYLSRRGPESGFLVQQRSLAGVPDEGRRGVAELLNMTADQQRAIYSAAEPTSAYNMSLRNAAVWCTDWNSANDGEWAYMFNHSYGSLPSRNDEWMSRLAVNSEAPQVSSFFNRDNGFTGLNGQVPGCVPPPLPTRDNAQPDAPQGGPTPDAGPSNGN